MCSIGISEFDSGSLSSHTKHSQRQQRQCEIDYASIYARPARIRNAAGAGTETHATGREPPEGNDDISIVEVADRDEEYFSRRAHQQTVAPSIRRIDNSIRWLMLPLPLLAERRAKPPSLGHITSAFRLQAGTTRSLCPAPSSGFTPASHVWKADLPGGYSDSIGPQTSSTLSSNRSPISRSVILPRRLGYFLMNWPKLKPS